MPLKCAPEVAKLSKIENIIQECFERSIIFRIKIRVVIYYNDEISHDKLNFISRPNGPYYLFCIIDVVFMVTYIVEIIII
jgi:hypothetical protein